MSLKKSNTTSPEPLPNQVSFGKIRVLKNAFANVARGSAGGLIAILLPPFLTRILSQDAYGTWLLILQLSAYVGFLDFGIQTAVGRFVAHTNELQDFKQRDSIVSTSLAILSGSGLFATVGMAMLAWQLPYLFGGMPKALHQEARLALLFVGSSLALNLPFSVFGGIFIGIQRYDVPAWIIGVSKLAGGALAILLAQSTHSIAWMGFGMAVTTVGGALGQYIAYRKIAGDIKISPQLISKDTGKEITGYCFGISVWTLGLLLVSGLDVTIVGFFDYQSVVYYTLAVSLTNFIIQLQSTIFGVLIPSAAILGAREDKIGLGRLLMNSTRYGVLLLLFTGIPLIIGAKWILTLWVGAEYASHTTVLLQVLVFANILRLSGLPYATLVMAVGQQRLILLSPLVEGISNFLLSVILTSFIGAAGTALGTMLGGFISIVFHFAYNMHRTTDILIHRNKLILSGILTPLTCALPSMVLFVVMRFLPDLRASTLVPIFMIVIIISLALLWSIGLKSGERNKLISYIHIH
jgi:O-antigen/teichoic acid export membrane protein